MVDQVMANFGLVPIRTSGPSPHQQQAMAADWLGGISAALAPLGAYVVDKHGNKW